MKRPGKRLFPPLKQPTAVELWHDGKFVCSCKDYDEAFMELIRRQPQSTTWALKYGGWRYKSVY